MGRVTIDVLTYDPAGDRYKMILVEEGPWEAESSHDNLQRLHDRLYDCVYAAVDGHLASRFPESRGKDIVIQLDCYDTPAADVTALFERLRDHVAASAQLQSDMSRLGHVRSLAFECNHRSVKERDA